MARIPNDKIVNALLQSAKRDATKIFGEFSQRKAAAAFVKTGHKKSGILDTNRLCHFQTSEDIYKKATIVPNGINHGIIIMLDLSGSMIWDFNGISAVKSSYQIVVLQHFCKLAGIPLSVYGFQTGNGENVQEIFHSTLPKNIINKIIYQVAQVAAMSDNAKPSRSRQCLDNDYYNLFGGGTPLFEAFGILGKEILPDFIARNRVEIPHVVFLTDGDGTTKWNKWNSQKSIIKGTGVIVNTAKTGGDIVAINGWLHAKFPTVHTINFMFVPRTTEEDKKTPAGYRSSDTETENGNVVESPHAGMFDKNFRVFFQPAAKKDEETFTGADYAKAAYNEFKNNTVSSHNNTFLIREFVEMIAKPGSLYR